MKWTQQRSKNAVAAKARNRMEPLTSDQIAEIRASAMHIKSLRSKAKWRIQITDCEHGDTLTLKLYRLPWPSRFVDSDRNEWSAARLAKVIGLMLGEAG